MIFYKKKKINKHKLKKKKNKYSCGKSYSFYGNEKSEKGLIFRCCDDLIEKIE